MAAAGKAEARQKTLKPLADALEMIDLAILDATDDGLPAFGGAHRPEASHRLLMRCLDDTDDHGMVAVHPGKQERLRLSECCQHVFNPVSVASS